MRLGCLRRLLSNLSILLLYSTVAKSQMVLGGVVVPGGRVPVLRLLDNFAASCLPTNGRNDGFGMNQLSEIMHSLNAEEVASRVHNALFFAMGDVDIRKLVGRWYTAVDSKATHPEECTTTDVQLLSESQFAATLSLTQHSLSQDGTENSHSGFGRLMGPDPGELLISTGHPNDKCPYVPIKLGNLTPDGNYDYIVLSQPLKHPTMVWTRDLSAFERNHKAEVYKFLEKHGFLSPIAALNTRLNFVNATKCETFRVL